MAAAWLLRQEVPDLRVRVVNVVDLFTLQSHNDHPHGLDETQFCRIFTDDAPVVFAFHGYPGVIHELIHHRPRSGRFHVRGYIEEGTTTTPFDMTVVNELSRYHLAMEALRRALNMRSKAGDVIQKFERKLKEHKAWIQAHDEDMPEILNWKWSAGQSAEREVRIYSPTLAALSSPTAGMAAPASAAEQFHLDLAEVDQRHHLTFDTYEIGKLSLDDYLDRIVFYEPRSFSKDDFKAFVYAQSQPYPEMIELIRNTKTRNAIKLAVVSNEGREG